MLSALERLSVWYLVWLNTKGEGLAILFITKGGGGLAI
jgi:hypothetical protein